MGRAERAVLLFLLFIRNNVNAEESQENVSTLLSKLLGKRARSPIIVVIDTFSNSNSKYLRNSDGQKQVDVSGEDATSLNDIVDKKNALRYVNEIVQSTGDENNPDVKNVNEKFERALRSRCEKFIQCEVKCKPKKKDKCKKSCQDVYDHLMMCNPPKDKWGKKTNKQVYKYLKKNPPNGKKKNYCDDESDECKSKSDECDSSDECGKPEKNECESSDSCN